MSHRKRDRPDGLPYRVYERRGTWDYSIGYKGKDGKWLLRLRCGIDDAVKIAELRREAIAYASKRGIDIPASDTVAALIDLWVRRQEAMPENSEMRRADSSLAENKREARNLKLAFGHMRVDLVEKADAYAYLDACLESQLKATKIALMRTIFEHGIRVGSLRREIKSGLMAFAGPQRSASAVRFRLERLIEWSPELRATLAIKRNKLAGSWYVFGNLQGQKYTKGGWKSGVSDLMAVSGQSRHLAWNAAAA